MSLIITNNRINFQNRIKEFNTNNLSCHKKKSVAFKGEIVNGNYYTDREYIDAMQYKNHDDVTVSNFVSRYGFFTYVFTQAPERHVAEVKKCIADIKAVERREAQARAEKLRQQEAEQERLKKELEKAREESRKREEAIQNAIKQQQNRGLSRCQLPQYILDKLVENVVNPFAVDQLNKKDGWRTEVPNAVLLYSSSPQKNEQIAKALGEQILQDKYSNNFHTVSLESSSNSRFEENLKTIKSNAAINYQRTGQRTIIFIPNFDKIATDYDTPHYNPKLNGFLKAFMLDCTDNGCTIFATAQNINNIEEPFLINKQRFSVKINL